MTIHKHFCPNCLARMEFAGAHCGREDCKSAAYVTALKASGATSVESFEDGRDPIAGPKVAKSLSKEDSQIQWHLFKTRLGEFHDLKFPWKDPKTKDDVHVTVKRAYPSVNQGWPLPTTETKYGVWFVNDPTAPLSERRHCWCALNEGRGPTSGTLAQAQTTMAYFRSRFPKAEYQIRVYVNENTPGEAYIEPTPDCMTAEQALSRSATVLSSMFLSESAFHLAKAYDFKWKTDPTDPSKPEKLKAEKLSDWTRVNFRDIPGVGRVCDYAREVPERNLTFKIIYNELYPDLPWAALAKYADRDWRHLTRYFKELEEAKAFCDQKATER